MEQPIFLLRLLLLFLLGYLPHLARGEKGSNASSFSTRSRPAAVGTLLNIARGGTWSPSTDGSPQSGPVGKEPEGDGKNDWPFKTRGKRSLAMLDFDHGSIRQTSTLSAAASKNVGTQATTSNLSFTTPALSEKNQEMTQQSLHSGLQPPPIKTKQEPPDFEGPQIGSHPTTTDNWNHKTVPSSPSPQVSSPDFEGPPIGSHPTTTDNWNHKTVPSSPPPHVSSPDVEGPPIGSHPTTTDNWNHKTVPSSPPPHVSSPDVEGPPIGSHPTTTDNWNHKTVPSYPPPHVSPPDFEDPPPWPGEWDYGYAPVQPTPPLDEIVNNALSTMALQCQQVQTCDGHREFDFLPNDECSKCMMRCSCGEDCHRDGNTCCLDKIFTDFEDELMPMTANCHNLIFVDPAPFGKHIVMTDSCPSSWEDEAVRNKCAAWSDESPELLSWWPVWSAVTGLTYRNEACGQCHGESSGNLTKWDISIGCKEAMTLENGTGSLEEIVHEVRNSNALCKLIFQSPDGAIIPEECDPRTFHSSVCVYSDNPDKFWVKASQTGSEEAFAGGCEVLKRLTHFNVTKTSLFCSLCDVYLNEFYRCEPGIDTPFPFVLLMSSKALLSVTQSAAAANNRDTCHCAANEVYDEFESKCRKLHCSKTRRVDSGRCTPFVLKSKGMAYELTFQLIPTDVEDVGLLMHLSALSETVINLQGEFLRLANFSWVQNDLIQVIAKMKKGGLVSGQITVLNSSVSIQSLDVKIKLFTKTLRNVEELESSLMRSTSSLWTFSVSDSQHTVSFQAAPIYSSGTEATHGVNLGPATLLLQDERYDYFLVDSDAHGIYLPYGSYPEDRTNSYQPVQASLNCSKVAFTLLPAETKTRPSSPVPWPTPFNDDQNWLQFTSTTDYPESPTEPGVQNSSNSERTQSAGTAPSVDELVGELTRTSDYAGGDDQSSLQSSTESQGSATEQSLLQSSLTPERTSSSSSVVHSVDEATGEIVLSLDKRTGEVHHHPSGRRVSYQYVEQREGGLVLVCAEQLYDTLTASTTHRKDPLVLEKFFSSHMIYASVACQSLSVVSLFVVLFTYCLFPELGTLPGKNAMGLVTSLLLAMLLFEVGVARVELPLVCTILGVVIHFCLLSAFTWMVICSTHMFRIFSRVRASRHNQSEHDTSLFLKHVTLSLAIPALIVTFTLVGNGVAHREGCVLDLGYGKGICYLSNVWSLILASILPICVAVVINLVVFVATVRSLRSVNAEVRKATKRQRQQLAMYVRMSTLTGINWLAGLVTAVIDSVIVWYIFIVLCGLQGVYVFVAFVCNRRVLALYKALLKRLFRCTATAEEKNGESGKEGARVGQASASPLATTATATTN